MRTAIYVEQGTTQLVLTPDNDWEANIIKSIADGDQAVRVIRGEFYECRGGWIRQGSGEQSLILRLDVAADPKSP